MRRVKLRSGAARYGLYGIARQCLSMWGWERQGLDRLVTARLGVP